MSNFLDYFGGMSDELVGETQRVKEYESAKSVIRSNIDLQIALSDLHYKPMKPATKDCQGCGAPIKHMQHSCEYCRREA